jgi:hypothetical protein
MITRRLVKGKEIGLVVGLTHEDLHRMTTGNVPELDVRPYNLGVTRIVLIVADTEASIMEIMKKRKATK